MSEKKNFHEIQDKDWDQLLMDKKNWKDVMEEYKQPDWCSYPDALLGTMGCWSLTGRKVTGESYCKGCDEHKES